MLLFVAVAGLAALPAGALPLGPTTDIVQNCTSTVNDVAFDSTKMAFNDGASIIGTDPERRCGAVNRPDGPRGETNGRLDTGSSTAFNTNLQGGTTLGYLFNVTPTAGLPPGFSGNVPFNVDFLGSAFASTIGTANASTSFGILVQSELGDLNDGAIHSHVNGVDQGCIGTSIGMTPGPGPCEIVNTLSGFAKPDKDYLVLLTTTAGVEILHTPGVGTWNTFVDPVISVDPDATFGSGEHFADFFEVEVSSNVVQELPEPGSELLIATGILAIVFRGNRRRSA